MRRINFMKVLIVIGAILIVVNNYQSGIDKEYPVMQLSITSIWLAVCFILYVNLEKR